MFDKEQEKRMAEEKLLDIFILYEQNTAKSTIEAAAMYADLKSIQSPTKATKELRTAYKAFISINNEPNK